MTELLLELFSEEIPARMQVKAAEDFQRVATGCLDKAQLSYKKAETFVTPRRLTLTVEGLLEVQPNVVEERKGPRIDAPENAIQGFVKSAGIPLEKLEKRETPKGTFYFAVEKKKGQKTADLLKPVLEDAINQLVWPKSMRWGEYSHRWVRPVHHLLCIFQGEVVPIEFGHMTASNKTQGHRFLANKSFTVKDISDYKKKLQDAYVVLDQKERSQIIHDQAESLAKEKDLQVKSDIGLHAEVTGLVEYPVVIMGDIDSKFMSLPHEVLTTSMRTHQKYFSLLTKGGNLSPHFMMVSNIETKDNGKAIKAGNEKVLSARLEDAKFFWEQDHKTPLESRVEALDNIIFHAELGTLGEKINRIVELAKFLSVWIPHASLLSVERAAQLCKADLATEMVGEFPELQGIMGGYYAEHDQEPPEVARAIKEHYSPVGPNDSVPTSPESIAVALADKIDTLVGMFLCGDKPTGSKDPFALRRAALGVIRIIIDNKLRIPLCLLFEKALTRYPKGLLKTDKSEKPKECQERIISELLHFFAERLKVMLKEKNVRHDLINAVFDGGKEDDLLRIVNHVFVIEKFLKSDDGVNLLAAYKRAENIVSIEEKKDDTSYTGKPRKDLLAEKNEIELYEKLEAAKPIIQKALKDERFEDAMHELATLRKPVDDFFDHVQVNCEDVHTRNNRLMLLSQIATLLDKMANFSVIEG